MYKLLIVDDEAEIREGLTDVMDFAALGFQVIGAAENGAEALRLAEELAPDLVITDIRMPLMDGLTMAGKMRAFLPTVQFLVLSGYDEFEYARKAIGISVMDYVLKPISRRELTDVMAGIKEKMDGEHNRRTDMDRLRAHFEASLPVMRELLLSGLSSGEIEPTQALADAQRYGIPLEGPGYALALIHIGASRSIGDPELVRVAVEHIAGEVIGERQPGYTFHLGNRLACVLLLNGADRGALAPAAAALEEIQKRAEYFTGSQLLTGVSAPVPALDQLKHATEQAQTALSHASALGGSQTVTIYDVTPNASAVVVDDYLLRALSDAIKLGDAERADAATERLMAVPHAVPMTLRDYRAYLLEILMTFMRIGRDLDIARPPDGEADSYEQLMQCPPTDKAAQLVSSIARHFALSVAEKRTSSAKVLVDAATAYIRAHFADEDISIEKVSSELFISSSYLTALFRKQLGQTFIQYLTACRMAKAMDLLVTTQLKTATISEMIGIPDPSYFSYSFKKHFGVSPSQVRKGKDQGRA